MKQANSALPLSMTKVGEFKNMSTLFSLRLEKRGPLTKVVPFCQRFPLYHVLIVEFPRAATSSVPILNQSFYETISFAQGPLCWFSRHYNLEWNAFWIFSKFVSKIGSQK